MSLQVWLPLNGDLHNQGLKRYDLTMFRGTEVYNNNGKIGKCFYSNGTNTIKVMNIIPDFYNYSEYSICAWFYIEAQNTSHTCSAVISAGNWNNQVLNLSVGGWATDHYTYLYVSATSWDNKYQYNFQKNTWYHVVVSSDGIRTRAYVNGILLGDTLAGFLPSSIEGNDICVGGATYYSGMQFYGRINDVRIYDHALSAKEIEEIAKGLVLHYPLNNNGMGGENLLKNTNQGASYWLQSYGDGAGSLSSDGVAAKYTITTQSTNWQVFGFRPTNNNDIMSALATSGKTYTLSFDIFATSAFSANPTYRDGNSANNLITWPVLNALANQWTHYEGTATTTGGTVSNQLIYINYKVPVGTYTFKNLKLEEGTTATAWSPAKSELGTMATTVYDCSGYSNNGTIVGELTAVTSSPRYDVCTYLECSSPTTNNNTGLSYIQSSLGLTEPIQMSVCWWAKPESGYLTNSTATNAAWCTSINDAPTDYNSTAFHHRDGKFDICLNSASTTSLSLAFNNYTLNEWHHYCVIYDGKVAILYKDGIETNRSTISSTTSPLKTFNKIFIGFSKAGGVWRKTLGSYADFRVYATALTADQVKELYNTSMSIDSNGNVYARELVS